MSHLALEGHRVWIAGHTGMVGSAISRRLARERCQLLTVSHRALDLRRQADVEAWMTTNRPEFVFVAAATVGGIHANRSRPAEFIYDNIAVQTNVIHSAWQVGVTKLLFLGSACTYPRRAPQPISEDALLSGPLELTNEWYSIAKIAGMKLCQAYRRQYGCNFISVMPNNLYGTGDNFNLQYSHVLPALIAKIHAAKTENKNEVVVWGSGRPRREFLFVDDCADALVFLMQAYDDEQHINIGTGEDLTIAELAKLVAKVVGFNGSIRFDPTMPDGVEQRLLDIGRLTAIGWKAQTSLEDGVRQTYQWYCRQLQSGSVRV